MLMIQQLVNNDKMNMKNILYLLLLIILFSCTKEIDEDILEGIVDVEELIGNPDLDPDDPEIDPITGEPIEEEEEEEEEEEIDPNLSGENTITGWQIFDGITPLTPSNQITDGNVIVLEFPIGTNITNISIQFSLPVNATVAQSTTGLNFNTNDGVKVFDIVAENGQIRTYAFDISIRI